MSDLSLRVKEKIFWEFGWERIVDTVLISYLGFLYLSGKYDRDKATEIWNKYENLPRNFLED
ncbi:hypothetical protein HYT56_05125 [Candidatus Woesearchaeota archaeon]|nr:hypothetical protein [Candidatus Woesearchaeota archaeon]